jgi:hypothetical protein
VESSSAATTCLPAPIANRIWVAVGERETIRLGAAFNVTEPVADSNVTGKLARDVVADEVAAIATGARRATVIARRAPRRLLSWFDLSGEVRDACIAIPFRPFGAAL